MDARPRAEAPFDVDEWLRQHELPDLGERAFRAIVSGDPVRTVLAGKGHTRGSINSVKMEFSVQNEARHTEGGATVLYDNDREVIAFYEQPWKLPLSWRGRSGRAVNGKETFPDFFVVRSVSAGFEEWKTEEWLAGYVKDQRGTRYSRIDGAWRSLPGERAAAAYGFDYRVRSSAELGEVWINNMLILKEYMTKTPLDIEQALIDGVVAIVTRNPGIPYEQLLAEVGDLMETRE